MKASSKNNIKAEEIIPRAFHGLLRPARYKIFYGGRGGAKSWGLARALLLLADRGRLRILCAREFQISIGDSVHRLLVDQIEMLGWGERFTITKTEILHKKSGSLFIFKGLRHNAQEIKSTEGVDIVWVEEAQATSNESWGLLIPTIRKAGSEIWISFNPDQEKDPTYQRFVVSPPPNALSKMVSYRDNPYFPAELEAERLHLLATDPDAYQHIWEGECWSRSAAQVLNGKWRIAGFTPAAAWDGPYFGADWGFSSDPTALIKFWTHDNRLYIEKERFGHGVEIIDTPAMFAEIDGSNRYTIRADNARPEIISHMQQHGFPKVVAAPKWPGSVEDGVSWLRGFREIVIHPSCKNIAEEARLWSYKVDKQTDEVLPVLVDKYNHGWDAIRYGAAPMIRKAKGGVFVMGRPVPEVPFHCYAIGPQRQLIADTSGALKVWEEPSGRYVVGAVLRYTGSGVSAIQVIDHFRGGQVACWTSNNATLDEFARIIELICRRYIGAWAVVDIAGQGAVVVKSLLKTYKKVMPGIQPEARTGTVGKVTRFGMDGQKNLQMIIETLATDGIRDRQTIDELSSFMRNDDNQIEVVPGFGHERVLALALARYGISVLPRPRMLAQSFPATGGAEPVPTNPTRKRRAGGSAAWKRGFL